MKNKKTDEMVINWHLTEACNYDCQFCYAKWGRDDELHRDPQAIGVVINELAETFIEGDHPLKAAMGYQKVRLNFAGGEPFLLKRKFFDALSLAKDMGFRVSIITNGHYLSSEFIKHHAHKLDMVGISFDAQSYRNRLIVGRADRRGNSFGVEDLYRVVSELRQYNPTVNIKINTVVNEVNWREDFTDLIKSVNPQKWKVLRVLAVLDDIKLGVTDEQFSAFASRHMGHGLPMQIEDNQDMAGSYLMGVALLQRRAKTGKSGSCLI